MARYGGGASRARIRECADMPLATVIRLMGAARRLDNPQSVRPGADASESTDADMVRQIEAKLKAQGVQV